MKGYRRIDFNNKTFFKEYFFLKHLWVSYKSLLIFREEGLCGFELFDGVRILLKLYILPSFTLPYPSMQELSYP